jgi:Tfp pilus assembly protein PilF
MSGAGSRLGGIAVLFFAICGWPGRAQEAGTASVQLLLKEGDRAFAHGDYDAARRSFEKAQQIAPQLPADSPVRYES